MPDQTGEYTAYRETVHDSFQQWYGEGRDSWTTAPTTSRVTAFILRSAPPEGRRRRRMLDIGCGKGHQTASLAEQLNADAVGLDLLDVWDPGPIRHGTVRFAQGDFMSFDDGDMDLLVDNGCLHHQRRTDWAAWVEHGRTLLRPGAIWVVSVFLSPHGQVVNKFLPDGRHNWWLTEKSVSDLFTACGFTFVAGEEIDRDFEYEGHRLKYLTLAFRWS